MFNSLWVLIDIHHPHRCCHSNVLGSPFLEVFPIMATNLNLSGWHKAEHRHRIQGGRVSYGCRELGCRWWEGHGTRYTLPSVSCSRKPNKTFSAWIDPQPPRKCPPPPSVIEVEDKDIAAAHTQQEISAGMSNMHSADASPCPELIGCTSKEEYWQHVASVYLCHCALRQVMLHIPIQQW